jgi:hypothetical protein
MCYAAAPLRTYQLARIRGCAAQAGKILSHVVASRLAQSQGMSLFILVSRERSLYITDEIVIDRAFCGF